MIILSHASNIIRAIRLTRSFSTPGVVRGFIKFTKGTSLTDKDKKALQKLLRDEKTKLQKALSDVDTSLKMLKGAKKKKSKKGKKR